MQYEEKDPKVPTFANLDSIAPNESLNGGEDASVTLLHSCSS